MWNRTGRESIENLLIRSSTLGPGVGTPYVGRHPPASAMAPRASCRSCRHCQPAGSLAWCRLRRLALHPELTADLSCHHWTASAPRLPQLPDGGAAGEPPEGSQLPLMGLGLPRG